MEPINSFFSPFKCSIISAIFKEKGFEQFGLQFFFYCHKKAYRKWASFIIFLYMHRNMLSTRLENQEGRDRLKCCGDICASENKQWQVDEGWSTKHLRFTGTWIPKTEGMKRTMTLQPETQRHPHISTTAKVGRASHFWYSLLFFKFLLLHQNFQRLNFFRVRFSKKFLHLKTTFVFRWS